MVRVKLVTKYPLSYCVDREKVEVTADGRSGFVSVTSRADIASGKFVIESDYVNVENEVAFGKKIPTNGLVLEFPIFEGIGTTLYDTSVNNNNGNIYGATWRQLHTGKWVLSFDSVDDYVEVPHNDLLNIRDNRITIEMWAYLTGWEKGGPVGVLIDKRTENKANYNWEYNATEMMMRIHANDSVYFVSFEHSLYQWNHYVMVLNDSWLGGYLNGELKAERDDVPETTGNSTPLYIGTSVWKLHKIKGLLGLVRIYKKPLSDSKIQKLYEATAPLFGISP